MERNPWGLSRDSGLTAVMITTHRPKGQEEREKHFWNPGDSPLQKAAWKGARTFWQEQGGKGESCIWRDKGRSADIATKYAITQPSLLNNLVIQYVMSAYYVPFPALCEGCKTAVGCGVCPQETQCLLRRQADRQSKIHCSRQVCNRNIRKRYENKED